MPIRRVLAALALTVAVLVILAVPAAAAGGTPNLSSPGSELRITLGRLLSEHVFLTIEAMRATATDAPDRVAATDAVESNTVDLQAAIRSIYGNAAAKRFGSLWREHIHHLLEYATATRSGDTGGREHALAGLTAYRSAFSTFLAHANPNLSEQALAEALRLHTDQVSAFVDEDFAAAFATEREAYGHMFTLGDALATAIIDQFPGRFRGGRLAFSPSVTLWLTLSRLLGEHLVLAAEAMRTGVVGGPGFEAAGQALAANSSDLAAAIESIYGPDAARDFESLWDHHISVYLAYIDAVRTGDDSAKTARRDELHRYAGVFGAFMAAANPYLDAGSVAAMIGHHTQALLDQVDEYRAGDFAGAYATVREAHMHMFDVGKVLAAAFTAQHPQQFPLPATDTEPASARTGPPLTGLLSLLASVGAVAIFRRRRIAT
jgi:hypothetical protein